MNKNNHYLAFNKEWFEKNQTILLKLLNWKLTRRLFKWILCIRKCDVGYDATIVKIEPNSYTVVKRFLGKDVELITDFRTHPKYGKRLYYAFKPMWWAVHYWDEIFADRYAPQLSYGFATLTVYPDAGDPGTTTCDGLLTKDDNPDWTTTRSAVSGTGVHVSIASAVFAVAAVPSNYQLRRSMFLFDTSSIGSGSTISAATISFSGNGAATNDTNSSSLHIVSCSPASDTTLVLADYNINNFGSTVYGSMTFASWITTDGTYNNISLDSNGIANVSKTGNSKFGCRCSRDTNDTAPTGANSISTYWADNAGTTNDPKLVVTYSVVSGPANVKTYMGLAAASVKTVDGLAIASVKTWGGLA